MMSWRLLLAVVVGQQLIWNCPTAEGKEKGLAYKVHCDHDEMKIEILKRKDVAAVYLEHLKDYPDKTCQPSVTGRLITFNLKFNNIYECLITKIVNKLTERTVYYHRVVVEHNDGSKKQTILAKCDLGLLATSNATYDSEIEELSLVKRQAEFPEFFSEDSEVEITSEVTGHAPDPILNVGVRQDGVLIGDDLVVKPGTPLNMEISLDRESADIYGLLVTGMEVTDTRSQTEPILVNGCSVDPYLFENFITDDGDTLKARFRAFKFPESNVVLFKGTVNVCLDFCTGVTCSNLQIGYGRKKREISSSSPDPNKVYEISMSTLIKLECDDCYQLGDKVKEVEGSVKAVSKKDFYEAFSARFDEFQAPGVAVFEENSAAHSNLASTAVTLSLAILMLLFLC